MTSRCRALKPHIFALCGEALPPAIAMLAADAIQIQELQRQLAAAQQRIQQLEAMTPFGEDFKRLAQQEAAEYTTIATNALKDAEEATGSKAVQKARQLLEAEPSPRNAALALAERTMSATRAM